MESLLLAGYLVVIASLVAALYVCWRLRWFLERWKREQREILTNILSSPQKPAELPQDDEIIAFAKTNAPKFMEKAKRALKNPHNR